MDDFIAMDGKPLFIISHSIPLSCSRHHAKILM